VAGGALRKWDDLATREQVGREPRSATALKVGVGAPRPGYRMTHQLHRHRRFPQRPAHPPKP